MCKYVCLACLGEPFLRQELRKCAAQGEVCDYCELEGPVIDVSDLVTRCNEVLSTFYRISSDDEAVRVYDRDPQGDPLCMAVAELLRVQSHSPGSLAYDVALAILSEWECDPDVDTPDDKWVVRFSTSSDGLDDWWARIKQSLLFKARFVNPEVVDMLERVFEPILEDRTRVGESAILEVGPGKKFSRLYRARVLQSLKKLEEALEHPERQMGPPPTHLARSGRMNAEGISVFYSSTVADTAIREVRPPVGSHVLVAAFEVTRPLRLLNFNALETLTLKENASLFDPATVADARRHGFLRELRKEIAMPVMPDHVHEGYLPSQAIADFLVMNRKLRLDGICITSSQVSEEKDSDSGMNVILFNTVAKVAGGGEGSPKTDVDLWYYDEGYNYFYPKISLSQGSAGGDLSMDEFSDYSLRLDRSSMKVCMIKGVQFDIREDSVRNLDEGEF